MKEMRTQQCQLSKIAYLVTDKIPMEDVPLTHYITTDSLLPNKKGRCFAQNLPPQKCVLTHYKSGDVLVANIRPYLKKIWLADREGGASADVLVFGRDLVILRDLFTHRYYKTLFTIML